MYFAVITLGGVLLCLAGLALVPTWWRRDRPEDLFFPGPMRRAMLSNLLGFTALMVGCAAIAAEERGWLGLAVAKPVLAVSALVFLGFGLATTAIMLVNRPRLLVPPRYRAEPGVWRRH